MKDKVFISSAQKELEAERLALLALLTTDPFLKEHVEPVLFERLPPPSRPAGTPYLDALKNTMMEQRGTGFERIRAAMLDHGLDAHQLDQRDGYFKVILPGPNGDYARLRVPADARGFVPPSIEAQLNDRQKQIMVEVQTRGSVSTAWVLERLNVAKDTSRRDFASLVNLGLIVREGRGRSVRYVPGRLAAESTDKRPTVREE
jgi:predicted HTH transcriptional regulator